MFLKKTRGNTMNTISVMASCITFNCTRLNGPPFSVKPIRLAGTWKQYSKKTSPRLNNIITRRAAWCPFLPKNFKCQYQAMIINAFERNSSPIVDMYLDI
jgi:hypothetical protein